jgi:hypothetical protein
MAWLDWLYYVLLFAFLLSGLAIVIMTLPGLWLMLASATVYALLTHGRYISFWTLLILLILATLAEIIETTSSSKGAKKAGAGRPGIWGALIGGIVGGIWLSFIPIPIVSTLVGVCLGTFAGAMIAEMFWGRDLGRSAWIGVGAVKGKLFGTFIKLGFGLLMLVITMGMGLPINFHRAAASAAPRGQPPTTATAPAR